MSDYSYHTSIFHSPKAYPLGFHGEKLDNQSGSKGMNIAVALSWIPIIGAIIGGVFTYQAYQEYKDELSEENPDRDALESSKGFMIRGVSHTATLGLIGPIYMAIDIVTTVGRYLAQPIHYRMDVSE